MKNQNEDNKVETQLNIRLNLGYLHTDGDTQQEAENQITRAAFITRSLFRMLELAATGGEKLDSENQFICDIQDIQILGDALQGGILESVDRIAINRRQQPEDILSSNLLGE